MQTSKFEIGNMKPYVRGKSIFLREVVDDDAEFILQLRTDPQKGKHLSATSFDLDSQKKFIRNYSKSLTDFYFLICDWKWDRLGTIRIYDIKGKSFCWGSWIIAGGAPKSTAIESALLLYDFAFFSLHYQKSHFDVRKDNERVVSFHEKFGAKITSEDVCNYYFSYDLATYLKIRQKYVKFLPEVCDEIR